MWRACEKFICLIIISALFVSFFFFKPILAEENLEQSCKPFLEESDDACSKMSDQECQLFLNKCLEYYQTRSDYYGDKVEQTQKEKKTFQNQIYILKNKVNRLNNEIYKSNLLVNDIGLQIKDTQTSIIVSSSEINASKEKLAELLQLVYEQDQRSLLEVMLAEDELSDFFDELANLEALSLRNQDLLGHIRGLKKELETEEGALKNEKGDLEQLVVTRTLQKNQSQGLKKDQESLLKETKGREDLYQDFLES